jgi:hypothetical protein
VRGERRFGAKRAPSDAPASYCPAAPGTSLFTPFGALALACLLTDWPRAAAVGKRLLVLTLLAADEAARGKGFKGDSLRFVNLQRRFFYDDLDLRVLGADESPAASYAGVTDLANRSIRTYRDCLKIES